ncbi:DUF2169 family type VI secretion system accessory protein [Acetobacter vaccinii]|uniref:DUF2169 domain-containing protein n=1 Tax=Acetobacter vaccinii TaxID=2592655 RepID=A0A5C1YRF2_9PROT|nr:DUF2169 domain-containing protein [Acetobacter vaccinii]QEO17779.1 DUF2169 domain-containing protein [Acetobacter vaccinii]
MEIENETPLALVGVQHNQEEQAGYVLVMKGLFQLKHDAIAEPNAEPPEFTGDSVFQDKIGRSLQWPNDMEGFKPNLDFIIQGNFYAPDGAATTQSVAGFRFGPMEKMARIIGPRKAVRDPAGRWVVQGPAPVAELPLRWEYSAGGLSDLRNPFGLGQDAEVLDGVEGEVYHLPMIEGVSDKPWTPEARPEPVNFAAVPAMFAQRQKKLGTRDRRWSLFRAPLPPDDYDLSYANAAPTGQQAVGEPAGFEKMYFYNMHPTHAELICTMPDFRPYAAAVLHEADHAVPVDLRLDTIIAQPDKEEVVILWRGQVPGAKAEANIARVVCHWCKLNDAHTSETLALEITEQMQKEAEEEAVFEKIEFDKKLKNKLDILEKTGKEKAQEVQEAHASAMHDIQSLAGYEKLPPEFREQLKSAKSLDEMDEVIFKYVKIFEEQAKEEYKKLLKLTGEADTTGLI